MLILNTNKMHVTSDYDLVKSKLYLKVPITQFLLQQNIPDFLLINNWEEMHKFKEVLKYTCFFID